MPVKLIGHLDSALFRYGRKRNCVQVQVSAEWVRTPQGGQALG